MSTLGLTPFSSICRSFSLLRRRSHFDLFSISSTRFHLLQYHQLSLHFGFSLFCSPAGRRECSVAVSFCSHFGSVWCFDCGIMVRKHGWQLPAHTFQVLFHAILFTLLLLAVVDFCFDSTVLGFCAANVILREKLLSYGGLFV